MNQNQAIEQAKQVKAHYEKMLLKMANVVGVGTGITQIAPDGYQKDDLLGNGWNHQIYS